MVRWEGEGELGAGGWMEYGRRAGRFDWGTCGDAIGEWSGGLGGVSAWSRVEWVHGEVRWRGLAFCDGPVKLL